MVSLFHHRKCSRWLDRYSLGLSLLLRMVVVVVCIHTNNLSLRLVSKWLCINQVMLHLGMLMDLHIRAHHIMVHNHLLRLPFLRSNSLSSICILSSINSHNSKVCAKCRFLSNSSSIRLILSTCNHCLNRSSKPRKFSKVSSR